jgi:hypothetical protein
MLKSIRYIFNPRKMKKLIATFILAAVVFTGCVMADPATKEGAEKIVKKWIEQNAQTYVFDGSYLERTKIFPLSCEGCFKFEFNFTSAYPGFGDRSGEELEALETYHTIGVYVEDGEITSAVTDGEYSEFSPAAL